MNRFRDELHAPGCDDRHVPEVRAADTDETNGQPILEEQTT
jgi:hypothetical protein